MGNVLSQEMSSGGFPCLCTFRPSGRKRLLVGKVLWWKLSSGGACPTCFPTLLYLPNCSSQKLCLVGFLLRRLRSFALEACLNTSSAGIPSRCLQNSTCALLDRIEQHQKVAPNQEPKRSLVADPHILRPKRRISTGMAGTRRVPRPKPKTSKDLKPKSVEWSGVE